MGDADVRRVRRPAAVMLAGLVLLGACACTAAVPGTGRSEAAEAAAEAPAPGTGRLPPLAEASDDLLGGIVLEAHRLAGATVPLAPLVPDHPGSCYPYGAYGVPELLEADFFSPGTVAPVLTANGFVAAWAACRAAGPDSGTVLITIAMGDAGAAARTVDDLRAALATTAQETATLADGTPATRTFRPNGDEIVQVLRAEGPIVSSLLRIAPEGTGLTSAAAVLDAQRPFSAAYVPTPLDLLPRDVDTRRDPVGLRTLTADPLPVEDNTNNSVTIGPYDLDGYLQFSDDPARERDLLTANGFTGAWVKPGDTDTLHYTVATLRFPSSTESNAVYGFYAERAATGVGGEGETFTVPSLPAAPCRRKPSGTGDGTFFQQCWVGYGSVLASISIVGVPAADDTAEMDRLVARQRDLIDG